MCKKKAPLHERCFSVHLHSDKTGRNRYCIQQLELVGDTNLNTVGTVIGVAIDSCDFLVVVVGIGNVTVDGGALLPVVPENDMNGGSLLPLQIHETEEHK